MPAAEKLTQQQLQPGAERVADSLEQGAATLTQEHIQPAARDIANLVHSMCCGCRYNLQLSVMGPSPPALEQCAMRCFLCCTVCSCALFGGTHAASWRHPQAQPKAEEVKSDIIQPLADKVKGEVRASF